jgi:hypothetical protein
MNNIVIEEEEEFEIWVYPKKKKGSEVIKVEKFTQSQSHGLFWDSEIRDKVFGLGQCINDTKKYDIEAEENKFDPEENVSIKTSSNNNIDCSDILRFFNGDFSKKYTIILIRYEQKADTKCIKEIIEIAYTSVLRDHLFGTISGEVLQQYVDFVKAIPSGPVAEEIKKEYKFKKNALQKDYNMAINISPKVDSKSQRRVQCSIPKVDQLLERFPEIIISRSFEPVVRNVPISAQIKSEPRVRNKKIKCDLISEMVSDKLSNKLSNKLSDKIDDKI